MAYEPPAAQFRTLAPVRPRSFTPPRRLTTRLARSRAGLALAASLAFLLALTMQGGEARAAAPIASIAAHR